MQEHLYTVKLRLEDLETLIEAYENMAKDDQKSANQYAQWALDDRENGDLEGEKDNLKNAKIWFKYATEASENAEAVAQLLEEASG